MRLLVPARDALFVEAGPIDGVAFESRSQLEPLGVASSPITARLV